MGDEVPEPPHGDPSTDPRLSKIAALSDQLQALGASIAELQRSALHSAPPAPQKKKDDASPASSHGVVTLQTFKDIDRLTHKDSTLDDTVLRAHSTRLPLDTANVLRCAKAWAAARPELIDASGMPLAADAAAIDRPRTKAGATFLVPKQANDEVVQVLAPVHELLAPSLAVLDVLAAEAGLEDSFALSLSAVRNAVLRALLVLDLRFERFRLERECAGKDVLAAIAERQLADVTEAPQRQAVARRRETERSRLASEAAVAAVILDPAGKAAAVTAGAAAVAAAARQ